MHKLKQTRQVVCVLSVSSADSHLATSHQATTPTLDDNKPRALIKSPRSRLLLQVGPVLRDVLFQDPQKGLSFFLIPQHYFACCLFTSPGPEYGNYGKGEQRLCGHAKWRWLLQRHYAPLPLSLQLGRHGAWCPWLRTKACVLRAAVVLKPTTTLLAALLSSAVKAFSTRQMQAAAS